MGDDKFIRLEVADGVARLVLARPPLNILNIEMMEELNSALERVQALAEVRALVMAAEGKAFSAGVAVEDHLGDRVKPMLEAFHRIFHLLRALPCPTVAAVQGAALGGGSELATFCDFVIASETATFGQPEIKVGVFPPIAAVHYPNRIGLARTLQLLLTGEVIGAKEAERIGLVDRVVPAAQLPAAVEEVLVKLSDKSRAVLALTRRAVLDAAGQPFDAALRAVESLYHAELMQTEDAREGLRAFVEKRAPVWKHR
ncbi:MAG: enoyl-CoA hydratase-related protein [candidate division NC10 bacterium]